MTYTRVIPRDLFNEGNLLKCYGQLYLNLERIGAESFIEHTRNAFEVVQDENDGSLTVSNVALMVRGEPVRLMRPMNSRRPFPLYAYPDTDTEIDVFADDGRFTPEMLAFLKGGK